MPLTPNPIHRKHLGILVLSFVFTRAIAIAVGMRYRMFSLWQLLDSDVLLHHLFRGLLHLHAQPPLHNAMVGVAGKLGVSHAGQLLLCFQLMLGLCAGICVYLALVDLGVNFTFSLFTALVLLLNPAAIAFEFDPLYTELVYALHCFIALALVRYLRIKSNGSLCWLIGLALCLTLVRATYQCAWLIAILAVLWWQLSESRRQLQHAALAGLLLSLLWPTKNLLLFHRFTSSTWAPFSMEKHWVRGQPHIEEWIREGSLPALTAPTEPETDFQNWLRDRWPVPPAGAPELDDIAKRTGGGTNWNSLAMLRMHDAQAKEVSFLFRHDPETYAREVVRAVYIYFEPSTNYLAGLNDETAAEYRHIAPLDRVVNRVCCNVFGLPPGRPLFASFGDSAVKDLLKGICFGAVLAFSLVLVCVISIHRRSLWRGSRNRKVFVVVAATTILYGFLVSNLIEVGENMRFRYETHALVIMVCAIFIQQLWDQRRAGWGNA